MKTFYIIGGFRSGTTLMRLCLDSHPKIHVFDEIFARQILQQKVRKLEDTPLEGIEAVGFKTPRLTEEIEAIDQSLRPNAETPPIYIGMVRHPCAVVNSMKHLNPSLAPLLDGAVLNFPVSALSELEGDLAQLALEVSDLEPAEQLIARATLLWRRKMDSLSKLESTNIVYEHFVVSPGTALTMVLQALGLEWDDAVRNHNEIEHAECKLGPNSLCVGNNDPRRAIDTDSLTLWQSELTPREIEIIEHFAGDVYEQYANA